jgi:haloacetate dehalogenase
MFTEHRFTQQGFGIHYRVFSKADGVKRPPLLLIHGYPQSNIIWRHVAPILAEHYTCVMPDLRGYGLSDKPRESKANINQTMNKRLMANDLVALMASLGHSQFAVVGHDRGGRVGHRMAVDHPDKVLKLSVLDISPTLHMYQHTGREFAQAYWWWFWLIQAAPFPELAITAEPRAYLDPKIGYGPAGMSPFADGAYDAYLQYVSDYDTNHAMCNDYRAAASIDCEWDIADLAAGRLIHCPLQALWGEHGVVHKLFDPLRDWQSRTTHGVVSGQAVACGHYLPEEQATATAAALQSFLLS